MSGHLRGNVRVTKSDSEAIDKAIGGGAYDSVLWVTSYGSLLCVVSLLLECGTPLISSGSHAALHLSHMIQNKVKCGYTNDNEQSQCQFLTSPSPLYPILPRCIQPCPHGECTYTPPHRTFGRTRASRANTGGMCLLAPAWSCDRNYTRILKPFQTHPNKVDHIYMPSKRLYNKRWLQSPGQVDRHPWQEVCILLH